MRLTLPQKKKEEQSLRWGIAVNLVENKCLLKIGYTECCHTVWIRKIIDSYVLNY